MLDGRLYVAGGYFHRDTSADVTAYDPATDTWTQVAPASSPRNHLGLAALDGFLYAAGGGEGAGVFADAWRYDPPADAWTAIAPMPARREAFGLVPLAGRLYAVGGVVQGTTDRVVIAAYDPATDRWTMDLAPLPTLREHVAAVAFDGRIWVIGGRWSGNVGTVEAYDPATDAWERMPDLPTPRGGHTAAVVDGRIHVTRGERLHAGGAPAGDHRGPAGPDRPRRPAGEPGQVPQGDRPDHQDQRQAGDDRAVDRRRDPRPARRHVPRGHGPPVRAERLRPAGLDPGPRPEAHQGPGGQDVHLTGRPPEGLRHDAGSGLRHHAYPRLVEHLRHQADPEVDPPADPEADGQPTAKAHGEAVGDADPGACGHADAAPGADGGSLRAGF